MSRRSVCNSFAIRYELITDHCIEKAMYNLVNSRFCQLVFLKIVHSYAAENSRIALFMMGKSAKTNSIQVDLPMRTVLLLT